MYKTIIIIFSLITISAFGQKNPTEEAQPIVEEGKLLYRAEMAAWYGTDLFMDQYDKKDNIGGYFSYTADDISKCIFFSKAKNPKVIGTISFDKTYDLRRAKSDLTERKFTETENDLYVIRTLALNEINTDTLFKSYENTSLNLIPIINGKEKKVYVLTGPQQHGVVLFGNDYLLTFNKKNKLTLKKQLHKNLIPIYFGDEEEGAMKSVGAMHSHLPETGDFITATDICTLMLYEKFAKWKSHTVVSKKYMNLWNCETDELTVIPMDDVENVLDDQEKKKSDSEK